MRTVDQGPGSSGKRSSRVTTTRTPGTAAKSRAIARRMACPSAAHDMGRGCPASPPPVTHSWTRIVVVAVPDGVDRLMPMPIRVIPVLDLKAGLAVRAIAGERDHYQPLRTCLHRDSDPLGVAR